MLSKTENVVAKKTQKTVANDINREYTRSGAKKKKRRNKKSQKKPGHALRVCRNGADAVARGRNVHVQHTPQKEAPSKTEHLVTKKPQ